MSSQRLVPLVVFISGSGTNLQALIDATPASSKIVLVLSNRKEAFGLVRAQNAGIRTAYFPLKPFRDSGKSREEYDQALGRFVAQELSSVLDSLGREQFIAGGWGIVLAGWMHILSGAFLQTLPASVRIINLHPALPGQFDGAGAIKRAWEAKVPKTGVMVHRVVEQVDAGAPLLVREVEIHPQDTLEDLESRIHAVEHQLIVEATGLIVKELLAC
jgi:formyltetrahydrofolate-dependent phosphoribosylglycinamide formyltransferase